MADEECRRVVPVVRELFRVATPRWLIEKNVREVYGDPSRADDALSGPSRRHG